MTCLSQWIRRSGVRISPGAPVILKDSGQSPESFFLLSNCVEVRMRIDLREYGNRPFTKEPHYMLTGKETVSGI